MKLDDSKLLRGADLAAKLLQKVGKDVQNLKAKSIELGIAFVAVGDDPASQIYLARKKKMAESLGIKSIYCHYDKNISTKKLISEIQKLNAREDVTGILVQLPIPKSIDRLAVINVIDPKKDVDGFTIENIGRLVTNQECLVPCTPQGCMALIQSILPNIAGLHAVVIGRSNIVGRPMSELLLQENCSVTMLHSLSINPKAIARTADIVIAAIGQPKYITKDWIKPGAIVIDVGITRTMDKDGNVKLTGDVDFENIVKKAKAITPVPGGVGPMTIAYLMKNIIDAAKLQMKIRR
jgi:methylenetetrahydrofolate dehydrogenase (NADP+)/methenyltetrahydrofolate cyclohydrolase